MIITEPSSGGSLTSYNTAARSGVDYLVSSSSPYASSTNVDRIGAAGWSLGARALVRTQQEDLRIDALVAWDNLAKSETGDMGSPSCNNEPTTLTIPRAPAMGQASESCSNGLTSKVVGFEHWRAAGVPAFQVTFEGSTHFWWGSTGSATARARIDHYTRAWFDLWLKNDPTATDRLRSTEPAGTPLAIVLSDQYVSASFLNGQHCPDLRAGCCTTRANVAGPNQSTTPDLTLTADDIIVYLSWFFA
ncbi:MAG: hypothetical protein MUE97_06640, partial [Phycisphaerales bacterium]|nr:hypothetical protein [Phycisphaerales bacterium]